MPPRSRKVEKVEKVEKEKPTIAEESARQSYLDAGKIANDALKQIIAKCVAGAKIIDICAEGDSIITKQTGEQLQKTQTGDQPEKNINEGLAFPTTVSVNNCIAHFSPMADDKEAENTLKEGDMVKIQLGAQLKGYASIVAHTLVVGASADKPSTGKNADVIQAAHTALQAAVRMIRPGKKNKDITRAVDEIAKAYETKPVQGMLSYQQLPDGQQGKKEIIINPSSPHESTTFGENEVYVVDMLISTGEGKVAKKESRTTIYKRTDVRYLLKLTSSRQLLSKVEQDSKKFPFTLRAIKDVKNSNMGIKACIDNACLLPFDVMYENKDAVVAQFLTTVMVTKEGNVLVTDPLFNESLVKSEKSVKDEEINKLLATGLDAPSN